MKSRNTILIAILSALACFAFLPKAQAAPAPETPDPASTVRVQHGGWAPTPLPTRNRRGALQTRHLAFARSLATQTPASTLLSAPGRSCPIPEAKIRPLVRGRFYSTRPAQITRRLERLPLKTTQMAVKTTPSVLSRSLPM